MSHEILELIRSEVRLAIPPGARVLVVSKGDPALLDMDGRPALPFPATDDGAYIGYHPADSAEAILRLERLRDAGAEYLIVPHDSLWWLEYYADFGQYLETSATLVQQRDNACRAYWLHRTQLRGSARLTRVVAIIAARNEERFISGCIEHLAAQGVQVYLLDHGSTDATREIASSWFGRGLIGMEALPFDSVFNLKEQLRRKAEIAATLDADWFMHMDADEIRLSPQPDMTLAEALAAAEDAGYNAVNFQEFTFVPTREAPDHDHPEYLKTMRWYYPFLPSCPWHVKAWRRQPCRVDLGPGGHRPTLPGMRLCPVSFPMKHYQFLSIAQARKKYGPRRYDEARMAAARGNPRALWRTRLQLDSFPLPAAADLREARDDSELDASRPRKRHYLEEIVTRAYAAAEAP